MQRRINSLSGAEALCAIEVRQNRQKGRVLYCVIICVTSLTIITQYELPEFVPVLIIVINY